MNIKKAENVEQYINNNKGLLYKTLKELCNIPAPSFFEHKRAEYCMNWLRSIGADKVYTDELQNVIYPINCEKCNEITVIAAHTDTVFPDSEPMPYFDDGTKIHSPGVGDNTASLSVLLLTAKYFTENPSEAPKGLLFICNSCEEGLGDLKGTKHLFKCYENRIKRFISLDSSFPYIADRCVGSHRYEVAVSTEGGHSFGDFGNTNAIVELSKIISSIYSIEVPSKAGCKTTYNVGKMVGGTSVNTVAQNAKMLCEYRSDDKDCLEKMRIKFQKIFEDAVSDNIKLNVSLIAERPSMGNVDADEISRMTDICKKITEDAAGIKVILRSSSTDCNVPLSLGIPAVCIGVYNGNGAHTREEWIEKSSLPIGLEISINTALNLS